MHFLVPLPQAAAGFIRFGVPRAHQIAYPNRERDIEEAGNQSESEESDDGIPHMGEPMREGMYTNLVFVDIERSRHFEFRLILIF